MLAIDLSAIPVVDNHCHAVLRDQAGIDLQRWRGLLTESSEPLTESDHVTTSLFYRRIVHRLAHFFGCEHTDEAVLQARQAADTDGWITRMLQSAKIDTLILDDGFPAREVVMSDEEFGRLAGCRTVHLLRVELLMQDLIVQHATLDAVEEGLRSTLRDVRGAGFVGLKSVAAYRTGLDIKRWPSPVVRAAFREARREAEEKGSLRLAAKPLLDTLLHVVFEEAHRQEVPVQFHTGYGDTDANMILANPLYLRAVLEDPAYRGMPVVLLHESYPYTREGAYLAAMYDRVYLDLSYAIPYLGYAEMRGFTQAALGVAPYAKLLYASDAVWLPEFHWISALDGRSILGAVLGEIVESGDLTTTEAETAGEAILRANATRLYGL